MRITQLVENEYAQRYNKDGKAQDLWERMRKTAASSAMRERIAGRVCAPADGRRMRAERTPGRGAKARIPLLYGVPALNISSRNILIKRRILLYAEDCARAGENNRKQGLRVCNRSDILRKSPNLRVLLRLTCERLAYTLRSVI